MHRGCSRELPRGAWREFLPINAEVYGYRLAPEHLTHTAGRPLTESANYDYDEALDPEVADFLG
jgi:hypothetical protein